MILIGGDYNDAFLPHRMTSAAIGHSAAAIGIEASFEWIAPVELDDRRALDVVRQSGGVWVAPGSPYSSLRGTLAAIEIARTEGVPLLGTCGGFQHVILEFARNVLGFQDAQHAEYDPYASLLFISKLACSLAGRKLAISLKPASLAAGIYGRTEVEEEYYCDFGVNPECVPLLRASPLNISGSDAEGEVRVVELPDHPFFVATLFVPQMRSTPEQPHPLVTEFVRAAAARSW